jgi:ATP-binding cassette subfamily F protein 1
LEKWVVSIFRVVEDGGDIYFETLVATYKTTPTSFCSSHGKTTLLRHIASRAFAIPPNIDILYCEQEVVANDTPAVEEVLKADVKRTSLLEECKKLEVEQEKGNMEVQARLKEVLLL